MLYQVSNKSPAPLQFVRGHDHQRMTIQDFRRVDIIYVD